MRLKVLLSSLTIVLASLISFVAVEHYVLPDRSIVNALSIEKPIVSNTPAFVARKSNSIWTLTLSTSYFPSNVKSIAITYNDIFYGVFLLTDRISLPVLEAPNADVIISSLDEEGSPILTESFTLGKK
jgi:hypothetical protein